jgi:hypothetical protein
LSHRGETRGDEERRVGRGGRGEKGRKRRKRREG